jgi:phospholipid/cholesterol/gamma-HCH transport system substrate-binding protein
MATEPQQLRVQVPIDKDRRTAVRAGLFIVVAFGLAVLVFVILGNASRLFERSTDYVAHFDDVEGLKLDSPVRLGGLTVGSVKEISFSTGLGDTRVLVKFEVSRAFSERVRTDSIARVGSRGLLGDKTIDISVGSAAGTPVPSGGELPSGVGGDITSMLRASTEVVNNVVTISNDLRRAVGSFTTPEVRGQITSAVENLSEILQTVSTGKGALHTLIYEPQSGTDLRAFMGDARSVAHRLDGSMIRVDAILREIEQGNGTAHALLYGPEGRRALQELGTTAGEVTELIRQVRTSKNAAAHELLFGESRELIEDLAKSAVSLKNITARIDRGDGSLGALISDPTAYEDLKTILGNVKRNRILRELVRATISNRAEYTNTGKPVAPLTPDQAP